MLASKIMILIALAGVSQSPGSFTTEDECRAYIQSRSEYITCTPILTGNAMKGEFSRNPDGSLRWQPQMKPGPDL